MPLVLDASVAMSWCFEDESTAYTRAVLTSLSETHAEVTALWPFEIANVLAVCERKGRIASDVSDEFLRTLARLDNRIEQAVPAIGQALLPLARRYGLTSHDAAYLELAKRKGLRLASLDRDLLLAASQEGVAVVSSP